MKPRHLVNRENGSFRRRRLRPGRERPRYLVDSMQSRAANTCVPPLLPRETARERNWRQSFIAVCDPLQTLGQRGDNRIIRPRADLVFLIAADRESGLAFRGRWWGVYGRRVDFAQPPEYYVVRLVAPE